MPDRTTIDSSAHLTLQAPGVEAPSSNEVKASPLTAPAKKARRPRPTFDDGALTRTFKFPSKAYPRSSYYVTSTEIIIRIKKARKKWKLIVPKKRVVSYRTNRWFAKPRWVAIELTFTQAVKLGLVDARVRAPDATPSIVASAAAPPAQSESAYADTAAAPPSHIGVEAPAESNAAEYRNEPTDHVDVLDEQEGDDEFQLAASQDESEVEEPPPQQSPGDAYGEMMQPSATAAAQADETEVRVVPFLANRQQPLATPRRTFRRALTALAAGTTGFAIWTAFDSASLNLGPECSRAETSARCVDPIVTGSVGMSRAPQFPAPAPVEIPPLSAAQIAVAARAALAAQDIAASMPLPATDEKTDTGLRANTPLDVRTVVTPDRDIAPASPPLVTSAVSPSQPIAPADCDNLGATSRRILINFEHGYSHLEPAARAVLTEFAAKLKACPASKMTIEGHTDSDGRADRNRTLSLWRAQAVHKHLVAAGVDPHQLATIGFGQARPAVPNVSPQNKRNNRRATLVVAPPR